MFLFTWLGFLEDFLFVPRCVLCRKEGNTLCDDHLKDFKRSSSLFLSDELKVYSVFSYHNKGVQKILECFKYKGVRALSKVMGDLMGDLLSFEENFIIVPIPLHWSRQLWRGFNQAFLLSQEISFLTQIPLNTQLKRTVRTNQQARLSKMDRVKNVENIFTWKGSSIKGRTIYLVDDVCTSGSTLQSAARVLYKAGAKEVVGIVFAR